ncbi:hypothetical protein RHGRI_031563 [Rhododendron griersonianum]|uniref:F-box/kelch-repeat protein n=1 Tax=Rhododendron griersonianum TaxID=479676 RepID=A0AAV6I8A3_9ERIC|nr:hypothetical protein RHGRI_031563 [Rhododendron griersonianum]
MAEPGRLTRKRKKEEALVKCVTTSSVYPVYEKTLCLCVAQGDEPYNPREWYMLKISGEKDKEKEAEEKVAKVVCQITDAELRGAYLAFHHDDRHQGELDRVPTLSPIVELDMGKSSRFYGTSSASIGSFVYRIGGYCGKKKYSRNVRYFDFSRPEEGLKRGPRTICARCDSAVVGLNGNLYVMGFDGGGAGLDIPSVWGEFLDTRLVVEGRAEWSALPDPPSTLGCKYLFAVALGDNFSGKILVLNLQTYVMCLYDVTEKSWESLDPIVEYYNGFTTPPIVVGTTLYWIRRSNVWVYDFLKKALVSMPIVDSKICWLINECYEDPYQMTPTLVHLAGDLFCIIWIGEDRKCVHCTKVQVSIDPEAVFVLACHLYRFDQMGIGCIKVTKAKNVKDGNVESRTYLEKKLVFCFGSYAAAQLLLPFGEDNFLSSADLKKAKGIATRMGVQYGWRPDDSPTIYHHRIAIPANMEHITVIEFR